MKRCGLTDTATQCVTCDKNASFSVDLIPDMMSIYPEYLTDKNVLICPSDAERGKVDSGGEWNNPFKDPNGEFCPIRVWDMSYLYYGWALKPEYYLNNIADLNSTADIFTLLRGDFLNALQGSGGVVGRVEEAWETGDYGVFEEDITIGNDTAYRLREGIERFFITDINNPAGTAQAQSEIAIMHDDVNADIGRGGGSFNHVPGGGNVLYLDGHVAFVRYPGDWPVCASWANLMKYF